MLCFMQPHQNVSPDDGSVDVGSLFSLTLMLCDANKPNIELHPSVLFSSRTHLPSTRGSCCLGGVVMRFG